MELEESCLLLLGPWKELSLSERVIKSRHLWSLPLLRASSFSYLWLLHHFFFFFLYHFFVLHFCLSWFWSQVHAVCVCGLSCSVVSNSLWSHGLYSPLGFVHGIFQVRIQERVAISCSRWFSGPKDPAHISRISCIGMRILYHHLGIQNAI